jgi:cell division protease FtsH
MVCEWGMSGMGPLTYGKKEEQVFLGRDIGQQRDYSEDTAVRIDKEVKELVESANNVSRKLLADNLQILHDMAHALLEKETIVLEDIQNIIEAVKSGTRTEAQSQSTEDVQPVEEQAAEADVPEAGSESAEAGPDQEATE